MTIWGNQELAYDKLSFIVKQCHPLVEESVRLSQAGYRMSQRFCHSSAQSIVQSKSAQRSHEDIFTQQQHLCRSSEVSGLSVRDSRHWFLASHKGILKERRYGPQGENLSLIMVEAGKGKNAGRYIIETRMDDLIKELNIDKNRITGVSHKFTSWNVKMMATTALLCTFSIAPYIYLNLGANHLNKSTTWVFDSACYWRLHLSHAHSTSHTTTNNYSFRPIPCQTRPAA